MSEPANIQLDIFEFECEGEPATPPEDERFLFALEIALENNLWNLIYNNQTWTVREKK